MQHLILKLSNGRRFFLRREVVERSYKNHYETKEDHEEAELQDNDTLEDWFKNNMSKDEFEDRLIELEPEYEENDYSNCVVYFTNGQLTPTPQEQGE